VVLLLCVIIVSGIGLNVFWYVGAPDSASVSTRAMITTASAVESLRDWRSCAEVAWRYFRPGIGVNPKTGINRAKLDWDASTSWDTGAYIVATIEAHRLGLVESNGTWGFKDRMNMILRHLLTRELGTNRGVSNWPYWAYYWDGRPYYNPVYLYADPSDSGRLLYALDLLRKYDSIFRSQVEEVFQRYKAAYDLLSTEVDRHLNYYGVLEAVGFTAFGYNKSHVISAFENWNGPFVTLEGQILPQVDTTAEPTLHGVLELGLGGKFFEYTRRIYEAQKARWERTGKLSGWSEGCHPEHEYVYEWIIDGGGGTWVIKKHDGTPINIERSRTLPLMYTKVAFAYLAIFSDNSYISSLFKAVSRLEHSEYGFGEATFENGESAIVLWEKNIEGFYSQNTNQIVLSAARYALLHA